MIIIIISLVFFVLCAFAIFSLFIGIYAFNIALNPKISKKYIIRSVTKEDKKFEIDDNIEGEKWLKEFATEKYIISNDNLRLHGYKVINPMNKSDIWVVLVHGYMGSSFETVRFAKEFIKIGYNTLLIDLRAHGKSEGKYISMGWKDKDDLINWIEYLRNENNNCKIVLYGISMGAATVMMSTGERLQNNVRACIEDCGYSEVKKQFRMMLNNLPPKVADYIILCSNIVAKFKVGYTFSEASCVNQLKKSKTPTLFIHGSQDTFVPFKMLDEVYNSLNAPKEKLVIKNAGHTKCSRINKKLYWSTVKRFIKEHINN